MVHDAAFAAAVDAIDVGDLDGLRALLRREPSLASDRRVGFSDGGAYFTDPYLLWFVANNPIRVEGMPVNVVAIATLLVEAVTSIAPDSRCAQFDYAVALVASGRVPREAGVQVELIDLLCKSGASPEALGPALAHHETKAAEALLARGATRSVLAAACLGPLDDLGRLALGASPAELQVALAGAAVYGNGDAIRLLLRAGAPANAFCPDGFHAHSTPLHQAVLSGSFDAVRALVEARADLMVRDRSFDSTPVGWAEHGEHHEIAAYLRSAGAST